MPVESVDPTPVPAPIPTPIPAPAAPAAQLVPRLLTRVHAIPEDGIVIGSAESADLRDTDRSVQPRHARLSREAGRWHLEDLNSASGTFLNGRRIDGPADVIHGDVVRCGTSPLELICDLAERTAEETPADHAAREVAQLRERISELERQCVARDTKIGELRQAARAQLATLDSIRESLARSRELHEAALAELRHRLAEEHRDLVTVSALYEKCVRDLCEAHMFVAELRLIIDAQQTGGDHE